MADEQTDPKTRPDDRTSAEIPAHFFGDLTDEFYAAIGRTTNLCALLEDRLRALLQAMEHASQTEYSKRSAGALISLVEARAQDLGDDWVTFNQFAIRVRIALDHRNGLVHNIWQPRPEGRFFGYRVVQGSGKLESVTIPLTNVEDGVSELIALHEQWRSWYQLAGALPFQPEPLADDGDLDQERAMALHARDVPANARDSRSDV
ncbi:hypothetical protein [Promicromonospora sp. NPDC019610]|uniref:hypothetical protein n=1 Tax=Promicromonospora sp. NPDC019610 TaxID=3364405 RepID=UPI0037A23B4A